MRIKANVYQKPNGVWCARASLGTDASGGRVQRSKSFPEVRTEQEAQELADKWAAGFVGTNGSRSALLCDLLADFIEAREAQGAAANTLQQYRDIVRLYVAPYLGNRTAQELAPRDFTHMFTSLAKTGGVRAHGLSSATLLTVYEFLNRAYRFFTVNEICNANPVAAIDKPKPAPPHAIALEEWDIATLMEYLEQQARLEPYPKDTAGTRAKAQAFGMWLALNTGLRVGEVCGLRWRDIRRNPARVIVSGTAIGHRNGTATRQEETKTKRQRAVSISERQAEEIERYRQWAKRTFPEFGADFPVVTVSGEYMHPNSLSSAFHRQAVRLKLDKAATFHTLRHTFASLSLASGIDHVTLAERMGHASPATTSRIYGHMMQGRDMQAAQTFDEALQAITS